MSTAVAVTADPHAELLQRMRERPWFQSSPPMVQLRLTTLDRKWDDWLSDLVNRPLDAGDLCWHAIKSIHAPEEDPYGMSLVVTVMLPNGHRIDRQCFTWYRGERAGGKGVVLVRGDAGNITYVLILQGTSIPAWSIVFDCAGGGRDGDESPETTFCRETVEEILGEHGEGSATAFPFLAIHALGRFRPDQSATPMRPSLFAGVISHRTFEERVLPVMRARESIQGDLDRTARVIAVPEPDLWGPNGFLMHNEDSYFLACMARLVACGVLTPPTKQ